MKGHEHAQAAQDLEAVGGAPRAGCGEFCGQCDPPALRGCLGPWVPTGGGTGIGGEVRDGGVGAALSWGIPGEGRAETSPLVVLRLDTQRSLPDLGRRLEKEQRLPAQA